jgi:ribonuclease HII
MMMNWNLENRFLCGGIRENFICGTDEAGRGPLAGDVYAAAVILPHGIEIDGLFDSKQITQKKRERIYNIIIEKAVSYSVQTASIQEIQDINILNAAMLAMRRAVESLTAKPDIVLVDGNTVRGFDGINAKFIIKGDTLSPNIAAASVLAKVTRDKYMRELDKLYPEYNFKQNKGYPTKEHIANIRRYGASPVHRKGFLRKITGGIE